MGVGGWASSNLEGIMVAECLQAEWPDLVVGSLEVVWPRLPEDSVAA